MPRHWNSQLHLGHWSLVRVNGWISFHLCPTRGSPTCHSLQPCIFNQRFLLLILTSHQEFWRKIEPQMWTIQSLTIPVYHTCGHDLRTECPCNVCITQGRSLKASPQEVFHWLTSPQKKLVWSGPQRRTRSFELKSSANRMQELAMTYPPAVRSPLRNKLLPVHVAATCQLVSLRLHIAVADHSTPSALENNEVVARSSSLVCYSHLGFLAARPPLPQDPVPKPAPS